MVLYVVLVCAVWVPVRLCSMYVPVRLCSMYMVCGIYVHGGGSSHSFMYIHVVFKVGIVSKFTFQVLTH